MCCTAGRPLRSDIPGVNYSEFTDNRQCGIGWTVGLAQSQCNDRVSKATALIRWASK